MRFRVQFGINLHERVFQKAEIARAASASTILNSFLKNSQVQINFKLNKKNRMITYCNTNMKKIAQKLPEIAIFFAFEKKFNLVTKIFITALHDIIGLQNFSLSFCQSLSRITMCNLHWCYTFCTGVTLFVLVLHLNCTALSQSGSSNFFMCIIIS